MSVVVSGGDECGSASYGQPGLVHLPVKPRRPEKKPKAFRPWALNPPMKEVEETTGSRASRIAVDERVGLGSKPV
jgi:hypothetical protein